MHLGMFIIYYFLCMDIYFRCTSMCYDFSFCFYLFLFRDSCIVVIYSMSQVHKIPHELLIIMNSHWQIYKFTTVDTTNQYIIRYMHYPFFTSIKFTQTRTNIVSYPPNPRPPLSKYPHYPIPAYPSISPITP